MCEAYYHLKVCLYGDKYFEDHVIFINCKLAIKNYLAKGYITGKAKRKSRMAYNNLYNNCRELGFTKFFNWNVQEQQAYIDEYYRVKELYLH